MREYEWVVIIIFLIISICLIGHGDPNSEYEDKFFGMFIFILVLLRLAAYFNL